RLRCSLSLAATYCGLDELGQAPIAKRMVWQVRASLSRRLKRLVVASETVEQHGVGAVGDRQGLALAARGGSANGCLDQGCGLGLLAAPRQEQQGTVRRGRDPRRLNERLDLVEQRAKRTHLPRVQVSQQPQS